MLVDKIAIALLLLGCSLFIVRFFVGRLRPSVCRSSQRTHSFQRAGRYYNTQLRHVRLRREEEEQLRIMSIVFFFFCIFFLRFLSLSICISNETEIIIAL